MSPLRKWTFVDAGFASVRLGQREHLVGHVEAVDRALRPDTSCREEDVDAASGAEVENGLALVHLCHGHGIPTTQARRDRVLG